MYDLENRTAASGVFSCIENFVESDMRSWIIQIRMNVGFSMVKVIHYSIFYRTLFRQISWNSL